VIVQQIPDTEYFDVSIQKGAVVLKPVVVSVREEHVRVVREKVQALGLAEGDVEGAIRWARGRKR
jgi:hypothetical protein